MPTPLNLRKVQFCLLTVMLLLNIFYGVTVNVNAASEEDELKASLMDAYLQIAAAEQRGADIGSAAIKLDDALQLIEESRNKSAPERNELLAISGAMIEEVKSSIPSLISQGDSAIFWSRLTLVYTIIFIGVALVAVYVFVPMLYWRLWIRMKKDWRIRQND